VCGAIEDGLFASRSTEPSEYSSPSAELAFGDRVPGIEDEIMQLRINSVDGRNSQAALHRDLLHIWPATYSLSSDRNQDRRTRLADETGSQRALHVGGTPLISSPELSEYFGVKHLLVKDESANPFG